MVHEQSTAPGSTLPVAGDGTNGRGRLLAAARVVLLVAVVVLAGYQLVSHWGEVSDTLASIAWQSLVLSFLVLLAGMAAATLSWEVFLEEMGRPVSRLRAAQVFLVGQLGKYVPGSVWAYLLQMELGRKYGILRARVFTASLFAAGVAVVASLVVGLLALPVVLEGHREVLWLFALLPIGLVCLHPAFMTRLASWVFRLLRKPPLEHELSFSVVLRALLWALLSYACYGTHLWLLANSVGAPGPKGWLLCVGAMGVGLSAGLFAIVLPSGVGVREAILVAVLVTTLTAGQAGAFALASRVLFTLGDLIVAGLATLAAVLERRRGPAPVDVDAAVEG